MGFDGCTARIRTPFIVVSRSFSIHIRPSWESSLSAYSHQVYAVTSKTCYNTRFWPSRKFLLITFSCQADAVTSRMRDPCSILWPFLGASASVNSTARGILAELQARNNNVPFTQTSAYEVSSVNCTVINSSVESQSHSSASLDPH